ncbi:rRNA binding protein [Flagelloscypha sp. PMI_526]|nr:rRNA binding protein [Flagelloscypha sp. PMI_526]
MGRRRKNRTHLKGPDNNTSPNDANAPKSFVLKHGQVGPSVSQLVRDVRKVLEPNTASRLRERSRNKLKDYLVIAPALHVTHLLAFTLTPLAPSLRIVRLSDGPTLSFRVERYSLMKDVSKSRKGARGVGLEYLSAPLLVLSSFPQPGSGTPPHLSLLLKTFQSLYPPLSPKTLALSSARRVVLISYNSDRNTIEWRHYLISVRPVGVSRRVRKLVEGQKADSEKVLDLGKERDIADFLLRKKGEPGPSSDGGGYESAASSGASDVEGEGAAVDLADDYVGRNNRKGSRRAVRLEEVGPRMELKLVKIVDGVPGKEGKVVFHEFVQKTKKEVEIQDKDHRERAKLRKLRREEQERNVARKKAGVDGTNDAESDQDVSMDDAIPLEEEEGVWDDEEEIEDDDESEVESEAEESSEDEPLEPPRKKVRIKGKR